MSKELLTETSATPAKRLLRYVGKRVLAFAFTSVQFILLVLVAMLAAKAAPVNNNVYAAGDESAAASARVERDRCSLSERSRHDRTDSLAAALEPR